jgi:hypothetical protein
MERQRGTDSAKPRELATERRDGSTRALPAADRVMKRRPCSAGSPARSCGKLVWAAPMRQCSKVIAGCWRDESLPVTCSARPTWHEAWQVAAWPSVAHAATASTVQCDAIVRCSSSQISWTLGDSAPTATREMNRLSCACPPLCMTSMSAATWSVQTWCVRTRLGTPERAARRGSACRHEISTFARDLTRSTLTRGRPPRGDDLAIECDARAPRSSYTGRRT